MANNNVAIQGSKREIDNPAIYAQARQAWNDEVAKARYGNPDRITYQEAAKNALAKWDKILSDAK